MTDRSPGSGLITVIAVMLIVEILIVALIFGVGR